MILHCKDYVSVKQKGLPDFDIALITPATSLRTFIGDDALVYLLRDNEIVIFDPQFEEDSQKNLNYFSLDPMQIDPNSNFLIHDHLLFFKPKGFCQVLQYNLQDVKGRSRLENQVRSIINYKEELIDCKMNFTVSSFDDKTIIIAFIKDLGILVNKTMFGDKIIEK
jgi:hypothetical protein